MSHGNNTQLHGAGKLTLWAIIMAVTIGIACGQFLAVYSWWPHVINGIENYASLTPEETQDLQTFDCFAVYLPFVLYVVGFGVSALHVILWPRPRWWLTLIAAIVGIGITGFVVLKTIIDLA